HARSNNFFTFSPSRVFSSPSNLQATAPPLTPVTTARLHPSPSL
ncbi:hypothetical protein A2U01_0093045, partial [Trifolium medium]|nr:hypothetical protein [Trifolium medium]